MGDVKDKKLLPKLLILILAAAVIAFVVIVAVIKAPNRAGSGPGQDTSQSATEEPTEEPAVALPTKYIVLAYPAEIKEDVKISYEDLEDGQKIIFTTDLTGEELELFRFEISKSVGEGYQLGVLEDAQEGSLAVCVNVHEYLQGNWEIEDYNKLKALQQRVNDIMAQIQEDPRFTPMRGDN